MTWRHEKIIEISNDFECLSGHSLTNMNSGDLQISTDLGLKFTEDPQWFRKDYQIWPYFQ